MLGVRTGDGVGKLWLEPSSLSTTRQRVRFCAVPLQWMMLLASTLPEHSPPPPSPSPPPPPPSPPSPSPPLPSPSSPPPPSPIDVGTMDMSARHNHIGSLSPDGKVCLGRKDWHAQTLATDADDVLPHPMTHWEDAPEDMTSQFGRLSSVSVGPFLLLVDRFLLLGLLLLSSTAVSTQSRLRGNDASNSSPSKGSRTGVGPTRRWLLLGPLALASGFRLPENNGGGRQIGSDVKFDPLPLDGTSATGRRGLASSTAYTGGAQVSDIVSPGQVGRWEALALAAAGRCRAPKTCGCGCSRA